MNKRIRKKVAKRYLDDGVMLKKQILDVYEVRCGTNNRFTKTMLLVRSARLRREIYRQAYRRGWDGNHWDDPMAISTEETEEIWH